MRYGPNSYYTLGQILREGLRIPWKRRVRRGLEWLGFPTPNTFIGPTLVSLQVTTSVTPAIDVVPVGVQSIESTIGILQSIQTVTV